MKIKQHEYDLHLEVMLLIWYIHLFQIIVSNVIKITAVTTPSFFSCTYCLTLIKGFMLISIINWTRHYFTLQNDLFVMIYDLMEIF